MGFPVAGCDHDRLGVRSGLLEFGVLPCVTAAVARLLRGQL